MWQEIWCKHESLLRFQNVRKAVNFYRLRIGQPGSGVIHSKLLIRISSGRNNSLRLPLLDAKNAILSHLQMILASFVCQYGKITYVYSFLSRSKPTECWWSILSSYERDFKFFFTDQSEDWQIMNFIIPAQWPWIRRHY